MLELLTIVACCMQPSSPLAAPPDGVPRTAPDRHVLQGAVIHVSPTETTEGDVLIDGGRIVGIGEVDPEGARIWDLEGLHLYAGFIDPYVEVETATPERVALGAHWNSLVTPDRRALDGAGLDDSTASALRGQGFVAAGIVPEDNMFRGRSAVVSTGERPDVTEDPSPVYAADVFQVLSFERRGESIAGSNGYPRSYIGSVALMRQTLMDASWQRQWGRQPSTLDAITTDIPLMIQTDSALQTLWAGRLAGEFPDHEVVRVGDGDEYQYLDAIVADGQPIVVPLRFPKKPDVTSVAMADDIDLAEMMAWEQAPTNPRRLHDAGLTVALTSSMIAKREHFLGRLRDAIEHGLSTEDALAMITTTPASLLGVEDQLGTIEAGKVASLVVCDMPIFEDDASIRDVWIDGRRHELKKADPPSIDGTWVATLAGRFELRLEIEGRTVHIVEADTRQKASKVKREGDRLDIVFDHAPFGMAGMFTMSASIDGDDMSGAGTRPDGVFFNWTATRIQVAQGEDDEEEDREKDSRAASVPETFGHPFGPYGLDAYPGHDDLVITNATLWTNTDQGVLEDAWIHIADGEIQAIGTGDHRLGDIETIDAQGGHVTPGLIDCHSHTALWVGGVNESGQACSAEVRISDCVDSGHVNWYRQLAGGLTAVNSLHGSANPIGGQSQTHKIRWGVTHPDEMRFEGAVPGIKFALGENVKQSRNPNATRYPQTRMGVETFIISKLIEAREYAQAREDFERFHHLYRVRRARTADEQRFVEAYENGPIFRRDLELEALAEILGKERWIHCHSYRQDEILMLCRVAERFGFRIGTFQHVLEGYKVADAIREAAVGASCFSDWWAYKVEVQDAIPENGAIMHEQGVNVSFNSDDSNLARRMNLEAAKAVRYGGVSEEDALRFVTLNPAIQLGIDEFVGSLEEGKHADIVLWSGHPLSNYSVCQRTWVDGRTMFSLERDAELRRHVASERARLIQKLLDAPVDENDPGEEPDEEIEEHEGRGICGCLEGA